MWNRLSNFVYGAFFLVGGLAFLGSTFVAWDEMTDLRDRGKVVMATTQSYSPEWVRSGRRSRRLVHYHQVQYAGKKRARLELGGPVANGTQVKVIYDPKNPENVRSFTTKSAMDWDGIQWGWRLGAPAVLMIVGGYWIFAAFAGLRRRRRARVVAQQPQAAFTPPPQAYGAPPPQAYGAPPAPGAYGQPQQPPQPSGGYPAQPAPYGQPPQPSGGYPAQPYDPNRR
ncbi:MAG TPA: DUF3592 domain-containing protein [Polyangia bacterium]|jgi:hypothetical protein